MLKLIKNKVNLNITFKHKNSTYSYLNKNTIFVIYYLRLS